MVPHYQGDPRTLTLPTQSIPINTVAHSLNRIPLLRRHPPSLNVHPPSSHNCNRRIRRPANGEHPDYHRHQ